MAWSVLQVLSYLVFFVWIALWLALVPPARYRWIASRGHDPLRFNEGNREFKTFFRAHFKSSGAAALSGRCVSLVFSAMLLNLVASQIAGPHSAAARLTQAIVFVADLVSIAWMFQALSRMNRIIRDDTSIGS
jgi:hypothetical protein